MSESIYEQVLAARVQKELSEIDEQTKRYERYLRDYNRTKNDLISYFDKLTPKTAHEYFYTKNKEPSSSIEDAKFYLNRHIESLNK